MSKDSKQILQASKMPKVDHPEETFVGQQRFQIALAVAVSSQFLKLKEIIAKQSQCDVRDPKNYNITVEI